MPSWTCQEAACTWHVLVDAKVRRSCVHRTPTTAWLQCMPGLGTEAAISPDHHRTVATVGPKVAHLST
jgi:hypothetical protein